MSSSIEQEEEPGTTYPLLVREASQADIRAISELLGHAFAEFEALYTPEAYVATVLPIDGVRNRLLVRLRAEARIVLHNLPIPENIKI